MSKRTRIPPPEGLTPRSQALWRSVVPSRGSSLGRLVMIEIALRELDRATAAREQIEVDGLVTVSKKSRVAHAHPLVRVEQAARQAFTRLWSGVLRLDWDPEIDGGVLLPPPHDDDEEEDL